MESHRVALAFFLAILLAWGAGLALVLHQAVLPDDETGRVFAVFPPNQGREQAFAAAAQTEAVFVRGTWLGSGLVLQSDSPGFVARLKAAGAVAVFRATPFDLITLAGCTGLPPLFPRSGPSGARRFG